MHLMAGFWCLTENTLVVMKHGLRDVCTCLATCFFWVYNENIFVTDFDQV